ncbi:hypothetical protein CO178_01730 [candidate division WWE3 bacterium CG_4_9_14_3_um_filter_34_6]|uniref:Xylose isomerase-like TIM barrel domain-containing protein n=1 Tax=candidate division WWE3 bacterium CG_4_9_14_3_um_filter_34_6 TaxID=1975079 RepID=A0A2M7X3F2_UNCKA|nr:MAG: hypothetical protein CO178_01730 [candidate division WWE3 bacterium CG_4_9_14_3_um_filter_34_6]
MVDQYYLRLPKSTNSILDDPTIVKNAVADFFEDGIIASEIAQNECALHCIVHGPFSAFDLRSCEFIGHVPERRANVPSISEVDLEDMFFARQGEMPMDFRHAYTKLKIVEKASGILGYEPTPIGNLSSDLYMSPVDYLALFLLQTKSELDTMQHVGNRTIVLHPDSLFYIACNSKENIHLTVASLNEIAKSLKCKIVFENVVFGRDIYKQVFPWAEDLVDISEMVNGCSNLGVCIDLMHLLRVSKEGSLQVAINILRSFATEGKPIVIHARWANGNGSHGLDSNDPDVGNVISLAYELGVPVVYEPDNY